MLDQLEKEVAPRLEACQGVSDKLDSVCADFGIASADIDRLKTANAVLILIRSLVTASPEERIDVLASADVETSLDAMGTSLKKANQLQSTLETTKWNLFDAVAELDDDRAAAAAGLRSQLVEALTHDEYAIALSGRLNKLETDAADLLSSKSSKTSAPVASPGSRIVETKSHASLGVEEAREILKGLESHLKEDPELRLQISWTLTKPESDSEASN